MVRAPRVVLCRADLVGSEHPVDLGQLLPHRASFDDTVARRLRERPAGPPHGPEPHHRDDPDGHLARRDVEGHGHVHVVAFRNPESRPHFLTEADQGCPAHRGGPQALAMAADRDHHGGPLPGAEGDSSSTTGSVFFAGS